MELNLFAFVMLMGAALAVLLDLRDVRETPDFMIAECQAAPALGAGDGNFTSPQIRGSQGGRCVIKPLQHKLNLQLNPRLKCRRVAHTCLHRKMRDVCATHVSQICN